MDHHRNNRVPQPFACRSGTTMRYHLLTLVFASFVSGCLLWRNTSPRHSSWYIPLTGSPGTESRIESLMLGKQLWMLGWPFVYSIKFIDSTEEPIFSVVALVGNIISSLIIVVCAAYISKYFTTSTREDGIIERSLCNAASGSEHGVVVVATKEPVKPPEDPNEPKP